MKKAIGIDLGTYFSEVSHVNDSGVVEIIPNADGELKTPSIVSLANSRPITGKAASPDFVLNPQFVVKCSKRYMGKTSGNNKPIPIASDPTGQEKTAVDIAAIILGHFKECAETHLGKKVEAVVVTVPAYFDAIARDSTKTAAKIAGYTHVRLQDEPVAAAIYYGLEKARDETIVVVDIGGGTTDVTAIEISTSKAKAILTDGDAELGGANYDEAILELMRQEAKSDGIEISAEKDLVTFYQNLDRAREGKEMLSRREEVVLIAEADGKRKPIKFTRELLRDVCKEFDDRFLKCCDRLNRQLNEKGKRADRVLLVGGSSRLSQVPEMVKEVFSIEPSRDTDPDLVVAKGAAIWAAVCFGEKNQAIAIGGHRYLPEDIKLQTVAAHPICVAARKGHSRTDTEEYNFAIVPANVPLPHEFEERFAPVNPDQTSVVMKIVQGKPGEHSKKSTLLREITVPIKASDKDADRIKLNGRYTEEGLLETTIVDDLLGKPISDAFTYSVGLTQAEIDEKREHLATNMKGVV